MRFNQITIQTFTFWMFNGQYHLHGVCSSDTCFCTRPKVKELGGDDCNCPEWHEYTPKAQTLHADLEQVWKCHFDPHCPWNRCPWFFPATLEIADVYSYLMENN